MSFPAYPTYRHSGVEWLGEVPTHWSVHRISELYREVAEPGHDELPILSVSIHDGVSDDEAEADVDGRKVNRSDDRSKYKQVKPNDLVYNMMRAWQGGFGSVKVSGMVSPAYVVARPRNCAPSGLIELILRTAGAIEEMRRRSKGVTDFRLRLYWDEFKDMRIALPPAREQLDIIKFLSHETAKIDALVEQQQRLIALLQEKRQAVISHAVTKGLNPDAAMKDSGIEWLGEVPVHWEVTRIKHVAQMESGHTPDRKVAAYWEDCNIPWVSLHDTARLKYNDYISSTAQNVNKLGIENSSARLLPAGVVVFSRDATIGRCAITTCEMAVSQHFIAWVCGERIIAPFLLLCLRSMADELNRLASGATLKTIGMPDVRTLAIAIPGLSEQEAIAAYARRAAEQIDSLVRESEEAVNLLMERRAALISAAVTGKIDLRGFTNVLPLQVSPLRSRGLIATEIIERSAHQATFGRVKLQKIAYLVEVYVGVTELKGHYLREAAGPLDRAMIHELEQQAGSLAGIRVEQPHGAGSVVIYRLGERQGAHRQELVVLLGDRADKFDKLVEDIGTIDTKGAEAVATLYAVWNDALIDGETPDDMEIKLAVLTEWHPEKAKKFRLDELQTWLDWMRRHGLVPTGTGPKTSTGRLFA